MIVIIKVINNKTQIPLIERTIACVNDNETSYKEFQIPRYINDIDLAEYSATIEIQPVNKDEIPYYDLVEKIVNEDNLIIKWIVKSHNTKDSGKLYFNLHFSKDNITSVPVYQTQKDYFIIAESVNAEQQSEIIPPSIFEQAVTEATKQANIAKDSADISVEAKDIVVQKAGQVSVDRDEVNSLHADVVIKSNNVTILHDDVVDKALQVSTDASQVSTDKTEVISMYNAVSENTQTVSQKTAEVAANTSTVNINTQAVLQSQVVVEGLANEVSINAQQVSNDKNEVTILKNEVSASADIVSDKADIVNTQTQSVIENAEMVTGLAQQVADNTQEVSANTQTVATNAQIAIDKAAEALQSAANALVSEQNAHTSAVNAEDSNQSALTAMQTAVQAMQDLLRMMGEDIATLTGGKLTPSQIPPIAITDTFVRSDEAAMLALDCETGDICIRTDENKTYILQGTDPSKLSDWQQLKTPTNYADEAGHAVTADNAENANKINNKRLVAMTETQYENAVKDPDTLYVVVPDEE